MEIPKVNSSPSTNPVFQPQSFEKILSNREKAFLEDTPKTQTQPQTVKPKVFIGKYVDIKI